jgi:hypothetical protein
MTDDPEWIKGKCPNGHGWEWFPWAQYTTTAQLLEALEAGTVTLHCDQCDTAFHPAEEVTIAVRRLLN